MSKICCFAGHSELYGEEGIYEKLLSTVEELIITEDITEFWVGNYGDFDRLSAKAVRTLKEKYRGLQLNLVIPYLTAEINEYRERYYRDFDNILVADIPCNTPKHLGIVMANRYMVQNSAFLVCYVNRSYGGAAKTSEYAAKRINVTIINLGM